MVKHKAFWKNSFKSIKGNISRYLAMLSIILLSSGIITGLLVSAPNMQMSMTEVYNDNNTADIELLSTVGFDKDSISLLEGLDSTFTVEGVNIFDVVSVVNENVTLSSLMYHIDFSQYDNDVIDENNMINKLQLIEGSYPKNNNEVVVERESHYIENIDVGSKVEIDNQTYKVTGVVSNSWYFSKEAERSVKTSKTIKAIYYKNYDDTLFNIYTNIFIKVKKSGYMNQFSKAYTKLIKGKTDLINDEVVNTIISKRFENNQGEIDPSLTVDTVGIYVLNRSSNLSYQTYKTLVNKVSTITQIFPIFFLVVSILVVLTTMTRLIEEERQEIGILRSLGYTKGSIYKKYLVYSSFIGIIGAAIGYAAGFRLIPSIVNSTFSSVFHVPNLNMDIYSLSNILYLVFIIVSIIITSIIAIARTLNNNVSTLLLPKAPKYGKRIILEKIPFIWNKLKFKYKSSLRNLFRYPNHFAMTVIGIAGSLALVFTGLSLINSISTITTVQYKEINKYDFSLDINGNSTNFDKFLDDNYSEHLFIHEFSYLLTTKKTNENFYVNVLVIEDKDKLNDYIHLRNRKSKKTLLLTDEGVIITEQVAKYMELEKGSTFEATKTHTLFIDDISENYINNYVFMTKDYYINSFEESLLYNKVLINSNIKDNDKILNDFIHNSNFNDVLNVNFLNDEIIAKERLLNQVGILALVIVLAAAFLAVVIIYNLTNVNISEREKELSTLKVLGYTNREVSNYVFREINIMTGFGIVFGIPLGILLQKYVITSIDEPGMMMGRNIKWYTYIISIVLTIVITLCVEQVMKTKIKKIDMIGALKEL